STAVSAASVLSTVGQSFGTLLSSFAKQPLASSSSPPNLVWTLVTQSLAFGSAGLPGVSARASHLSNPAAFLAMAAGLPARHFACWADAGAAGKSRSVTSAVPIERLVMSPSDEQRSKRWKTARRRMLQRGTTRHTIGWLCQRIWMTLALRKAARLEGLSIGGRVQGVRVAVLRRPGSRLVG